MAAATPKRRLPGLIEEKWVGNGELFFRIKFSKAINKITIDIQE
jgi:hypothetical protein